MQQIADWLKKLGLAEYGERFAENGIDVSVLPHLTDQDLKDMGVLLGHRRKMLAAIGELSSKPGAAPATGTPIGPASIPTASPIAPAVEAAGERRYLTVMFCDLVDSTGIAARLDARRGSPPEVRSWYALIHDHRARPARRKRSPRHRARHHRGAPAELATRLSVDCQLEGTERCAAHRHCRKG